jgi:glycosyltransferase involved in cell wall biosynthesis
VTNAHFLPNYGWLAVRAGIHPLVLTALGSDILTVPQRSPLHAWRTRWVLARCDAVTSDARMLTDAVRGFGVAAERILTVPLGIEAQRFATQPVRATSPLVVLSSRRLEPIYDVATLLRACGGCPPIRDGAADRGRRCGRSSASIASRAGSAISRWLAMSDLDRELRTAHIYVSTSLSDSTSVSLLEAMAAGCFPVVSDIPANREWIVDGETACCSRAATTRHWPPHCSALRAIRPCASAPRRATARSSRHVRPGKPTCATSRTCSNAWRQSRWVDASEALRTLARR